ncbi:MAG: hypothetical protein ACE5IK_00145 [Acidobacteriota bacterium]
MMGGISCLYSGGAVRTAAGVQQRPGVTVTRGFRKNIEDLLEEWRPPGGMAALLLEHPTAGVYFPLAVQPAAENTDYYSMPVRFRDGCDTSLQLDETSSPERLAFRGRLELTRPDLRLPVRQELVPLHQDGDGGLKVLLLRSSPGTMPDMEPRNLNTLKNLVPLTCLNWVEQAQRSIEIPEFSSFEELAQDLVKRLSDVEQDPPYFPILHAEVTPDAEALGARFSSANLLSWNCYLLDDQRSMPAYIPQMPTVMGEKKIHEWWEDVTRRADASSMTESIRKAAAKTIDHVRLIGRCDHDGVAWWAFARHNKDRREMTGLLCEWSEGESILSAAEAWRDVDPITPGDLVRRALAVRSDEDDVLVTMWLVSDTGQGINIGFKAGNRIEVLDHAEMGGADQVEITEFVPFCVRLSPLPLVDRQVIEDRVRPVLASAARAARRIDGSGLIESAFEPVRRELHEGSWHDAYPGSGLFVDRFHDVADWTDEDVKRCHERMVVLLDGLLTAWTGNANPLSRNRCETRFDCWHIRALKALAHDRLHSSLVMAVLSGPVSDASYLLADREICPGGNVRWSDLLAALTTVTTEGNRFRLKQWHHGARCTLILRFSGQLNPQGVTAALTGEGAQERQGSFTRACETLRRAARRFGVEIDHDGDEDERWSLVVVLAESELAC